MFYLARWTADDSDPAGLDVRPDVPDGAGFAAIDLRSSDKAKSGNHIDEGWCLVKNTTPSSWTERPGHLVKVGEAASDVPGNSGRAAFARAMGGYVISVGDSVGDSVLDFLIYGSDDQDGSKPNKPRPRRDGSRRLILGGETIATKLPFTTLSATATDNFNRTDAGSSSVDGLGADWTWITTANGAFTIVSNECVSTTRGGGVIYSAYDATTMATDNHWAEIDVLEDEYQQTGICVRMLGTTANSSGYMAYYDNGYDRIRYTNTAAAPSRTTLTQQSVATTPPFTLRCLVDGSELTAYHDGTIQSSLTTTDTTYPGASTRRLTGMYAYQSGGDTDNFSASDDLVLVEVGGGISAAVALTGGLSVIKDFGGDVPIAVTLAGGVTVSVDLDPDPLTITSTLFGSIDTTSVLGGDISMTSALTGDMASGKVLRGDVSVDVTGTGEMFLTRGLGGDIPVVMALALPNMTKTIHPAGDVNMAVDLYGKLAPLPIAGALSTEITLSATAATTTKMGGGVYSYMTLSLGEPVTHLRTMLDAGFVDCWPTTYLGGTWYRGRAKIWDGTEWLDPDVSSALVAADAVYWYSAQSITDEAQQEIANSILVNPANAMRGTTSGVDAADPGFAIQTDNFVRLPGGDGNSLTHAAVLDSSAADIGYRARIRRVAGASERMLALGVSGVSGQFTINSDGTLSATVDTVTLTQAVGVSTLSVPALDGDLVWVEAYWNTVDGNWIFRYSLEDLSDPEEVAWVDLESIAWAADTFDTTLDTAIITAGSAGSYDLYYAAVTQDAVVLPEAWPERDATHGSYGAPDYGQAAFGGWTVERTAIAPRTQVINANAIRMDPGDELQIPAATVVYVLAREWPAGTTSLREDIDPMAGTFDGEIFDIVGFAAPLSVDDKAQMEIELLYGAYKGSET